MRLQTLASVSSLVKRFSFSLLRAWILLALLLALHSSCAEAGTAVTVAGCRAQPFRPRGLQAIAPHNPTADKMDARKGHLFQSIVTNYEELEKQVSKAVRLGNRHCIHKAASMQSPCTKQACHVNSCNRVCEANMLKQAPALLVMRQQSLCFACTCSPFEPVPDGDCGLYDGGNKKDNSAITVPANMLASMVTSNLDYPGSCGTP